MLLLWQQHFKSLRPPSEVTGLDGDWLIKCLLHSQACLDGRQEREMEERELAWGGGLTQPSAPSVCSQ